MPLSGNSLYNPDGTVASAEAGTANADGTGFVSLQQVATSYDAALRKTRQVLTAGGTTYGVTEYSYDSVGRSDCVAVRLNPGQWGTPTAACTAQTAGSDGPDRISRVTYDDAGRALTMTTAYGTGDAATETVSYTNNGQVSTATDAENNTTSYAYDGDDRLSTTTYPSTTRGAGTSNTGDREVLTYDDAGNGVVSTYGYDNVSRLTSLASNPAGTTYDLTLGFVYNNAGQIASTTRSNDIYSWTGAANVTRAYTSNGLNQFTASGAVSLGYDARGNLTSSGSDSYTYSSENLLLTGPTGASLSYDPLLRLYEASNTTASVSRFLYDGTQLIGNLNSSGVYTRRYVTVPGNDELIAEYKVMSGTMNWKLTDERGSVIAAVDSSGNASNPNTYDEYGIPGSGNLARYQYTGQIWLPEVGLYYYKARMYSPTLGRFMQTDLIGYDDGINWYNYVDGDPVNFSDPSGLDENLGDIVITSGRLSFCELNPFISICSGSGPSGTAVGTSSPLSGGSGGSDIVITSTRNQSSPAPKRAPAGSVVKRVINGSGNAEISCCEISILGFNIKIDILKHTFDVRKWVENARREQREYDRTHPNQTPLQPLGVEPYAP